MTQPVQERPSAPSGYGYATEPDGMLPWEKVREALAEASIYWVATVRSDGAPHLHSIWGGFVGQHLYFEGGEDTRWARNLAQDSRVGFGVESQGLHISGRGVVERAYAGDEFDSLAANYQAKYQYRPVKDGRFFRISPEIVIALDMSSMESFASSPTRFRFQS
ncbi:MAG TPA: pyridoxamine 5'-phosphate oxidase family protein [Acidimicrobiia bacterium]|nr:pyridoxamine 5'-phosphate oxidase family protein [Acidimicrobiia bacterium]